MADKLFLNLDELIDEQPQRFVTYKGVEYPVAGMTGELFIKFMKTQSKRAKALESGDRGAQFEEGINMVLLCVPGLTDKQEELMGLKLPVLNRLADFLSGELHEDLSAASGEAATEDGSAETGE